MEFCKAVNDDLAGTRAVLIAAFDDYVRALGRELNENSFSDLGAAVADGNVWLARTPQGIAGVVVLSTKDSHWHIEEVAVAPHSQGQGVGTFLLQCVEQRARTFGVETLSLYTAKIMQSLITFYQSHGYASFDEGLPAHGRDTHVRVYMRKMLS